MTQSIRALAAHGKRPEYQSPVLMIIDMLVTTTPAQ